MNFLTAEWRKLAVINYEIDPIILLKYVPEGTELDFYQEKCYVSLVGFMFLNTKLLGISVPFHRNFEEVNLRFYVKKKENSTWKRGVVFVKEIVPKAALSIVANTFYNENYKTLPMKNKIEIKDENLHVNYAWKEKNWHSIDIIAENEEKAMEDHSEFEFITEHYFGFTKNGKNTLEYEVCHPKWTYYPIISHQIKVNFEEVYGQDFSCLNEFQPISVMLAEGSKIEVKTKSKIV